MAGKEFLVHSVLPYTWENGETFASAYKDDLSSYLSTVHQTPETSGESEQDAYAQSAQSTENVALTSLTVKGTSLVTENISAKIQEGCTYDPKSEKNGTIEEENTANPVNIYPDGTGAKYVDTPCDTKNLFKCHRCDASFLQNSGLIKHLTNRHEIRKTTYNCPYCGSVFALKRDRESHVRAHYEKNRHTCELCGITVVFRSNMLSHMKKHKLMDKQIQGFLPSRSFKCAYCDTLFIKKQMLVNHIQHMHKGKNFAYKYCYRTFTASSKFAHPLGHLKEMPCPEKDESSKNLYKCDYCPKVFSTRTNFILHTRNMHKRNPYKCNSCTKEFGLKTELTLHVQESHPEGLCL